MRRVTRSLTKSKTQDSPMKPSTVDLKIGRINGRTVALEATPEHLTASKMAPIPDLSQRIDELTRENGRLRLEIKYYQDFQVEIQDLLKDMEFVTETIESRLIRFTKVEEEVENDRCYALGGQ